MGSHHRDISRTVVLLTALLAQTKTCLLFSLFALFSGICYIIREKQHCLKGKEWEGSRSRWRRSPHWYERSRKISCEENLSLRLLCKGRGIYAQSDLDFLVFGRDGFRLTEILSLGEEFQEFSQKKVDIFEIREVSPDSDFYHTIMKEKVLVA